MQYKSAHDGNLAAAQPRKTINPLSLYRIKKQQPTRERQSPYQSGGIQEKSAERKKAQ